MLYSRYSARHVDPHRAGTSCTRLRTATSSGIAISESASASTGECSKKRMAARHRARNSLAASLRPIVRARAGRPPERASQDDRCAAVSPVLPRAWCTVLRIKCAAQSTQAPERPIIALRTLESESVAANKRSEGLTPENETLFTTHESIFSYFCPPKHSNTPRGKSHATPASKSVSRTTRDP